MAQPSPQSNSLHPSAADVIERALRAMVRRNGVYDVALELRNLSAVSVPVLDLKAAELLERLDLEEASDA
jgi:lipopolysaccharide biosynthesis protein